ncbi:hypothetical protein SAMN04487934_11434 [Eubacterium ruminantium]|nr:hypothetical protein SAMN04487934_11434 [Eubacterium ruminantium]
MGNLGPDSFWDLNHDGKLSDSERALRDQEIISGFNAVGNVGRNSGSSGKSKSNGKWSLLEFIIIATIVCIIGYAVKAFLGELFATVVIIIIGIALWNS